MKNISYVIGLVLGSVIIAPLIIYFYQKYISLNDGYKYVDAYISNSETIALKIRVSFYVDYLHTNDDPYLESYTLRGSTTSADRESYPFYSEEYKKYFAIQFFNGGTAFIVGFQRYKFDDTIMATVNSQELANPNYGTEKNPVPILKFGIKGKDSLFTITDKKYRFSVAQHLTYFVSKKDFKKMFSK